MGREGNESTPYSEVFVYFSFIGKITWGRALARLYPRLGIIQVSARKQSRQPLPIVAAGFGPHPAISPLQKAAHGDVFGNSGCPISPKAAQRDPGDKVNRMQSTALLSRSIALQG